MGLFDFPAPLFAALDGSLDALPSGVRLALWGAVAGVGTMLLYRALSPQSQIEAARRNVEQCRQALERYEGEFSEAGKLIREMLKHALRHVGLVTGPAVLASVPVVCLAVWLSTAYGHTWPAPSDPVEVEVAPASLSAMWQDDRRIVVTNGRSQRPLQTLRPAAPVPVLHRRRWWNRLVANPAGYLPEGGPTQRVEIHLPRQQHLAIGPPWMRGWEVTFFTALALVAVLVKVALRIR